MVDADDMIGTIVAVLILAVSAVLLMIFAEPIKNLFTGQGRQTVSEAEISFGNEKGTEQISGEIEANVVNQYNAEEIEVNNIEKQINYNIQNNYYGNQESTEYKEEVEQNVVGTEAGQIDQLREANKLDDENIRIIIGIIGMTLILGTVIALALNS
jgi:hypothetical protein